jgi:hypothetical protein
MQAASLQARNVRKDGGVSWIRRIRERVDDVRGPILFANGWAKTSETQGGAARRRQTNLADRDLQGAVGVDEHDRNIVSRCLQLRSEHVSLGLVG